MANNKRRKKDGERKDKKRQRMHADIAARKRAAGPPRPSRDEVDTVKYKRGSAADRTRPAAP
jgi:hypothetical protein